MLKCVRDRLLLKEYVHGHVTSLKFGEISENISETVQDSDIVAMEDLWEMVRGLLNGTITNWHSGNYTTISNNMTFWYTCPR